MFRMDVIAVNWSCLVQEYLRSFEVLVVQPSIKQFLSDKFFSAPPVPSLPADIGNTVDLDLLD